MSTLSRLGLLIALLVIFTFVVAFFRRLGWGEIALIAAILALAFVVDRLRERGFRLFDIQYRTDHTTRLGAVEIPRGEYLARLRRALACPVTFP